MTLKPYVNAQGKYLGTYDTAPDGGIEATGKPPSDYHRFNGVNWVVDEAARQAALEAEVQENADEITQNGDRDVAMALATVDLVMAARDGNLNGRTRPQIRSAYRDRVVFYLRQKRGLS